MARTFPFLYSLILYYLALWVFLVNLCNLTFILPLGNEEQMFPHALTAARSCLSRSHFLSSSHPERSPSLGREVAGCSDIPASHHTLLLSPQSPGRANSAANSSQPAPTPRHLTPGRCWCLPSAQVLLRGAGGVGVSPPAAPPPPRL